jgi:hypothetical protein
VQRTTLGKLAAIVGVLIVGICLGVAGTWASHAVEDRPVTVSAYEVSQSDWG